MILQHVTDAIFFLILLENSVLNNVKADPIISSGEVEVLEQCCTKGQNHSGSASAQCGEFPVPIADILQEHQTLCIATLEVCCLSAKRQLACQKGLQKAKGQDHDMVSRIFSNKNIMYVLTCSWHIFTNSESKYKSTIFFHKKCLVVFKKELQSVFFCKNSVYHIFDLKKKKKFAKKIVDS